VNASNSRSHYVEVLEEHLHPHLRARMLQRGVTREEIERTLNDGWERYCPLDGNGEVWQGFSEEGKQK